MYNELDWAVKKQLSRVIRECRAKKIETSICGQAGSNKEMVGFLVKLGINSISVNADSAREISELVRDLETGKGWGDKSIEKGQEQVLAKERWQEGGGEGKEGKIETEENKTERKTEEDNVPEVEPEVSIEQQALEKQQERKDMDIFG